ncbi:MAG: putative diguanylate cyclase [Methanocella sp. PtaU1.Bin125]|nr:MAG: putative diguanylate cyclase [Methanocella sp. PtaU1.Bin125]
MRVRSKTLIIAAITIIAWIFLVYTAAQAVLLQSYTDLEAQSVREDVSTALRLIENDRSSIDSTVADYANWDDTARYLIDRDPGYIDANFVDATLLNLRMNVVVLADANDSVTYIKSVDLAGSGEAPVPDGLTDHLGPGSPLFRSSHSDRLSGIISLPGGPMMISAYPVKNSEATGPSKGTIIMGRFLDRGEIDRLEEIAGIRMALVPLDSEGTPDLSDAARSSGDGAVLVAPVNGSLVSGYAVLWDVYGSPVTGLRVDLPRTIYAQWQTSILNIIVILLILSIPVAVLGVFLVDKFVVGQIVRMSRRISQIGADDDFSGRLTVSGDDEVSAFGEKINETLEALERSRQSLRASEQKYRGLVENISDIVWETDRDQRLTYLSPKVRDVTGFEPGEALGKTPEELASITARNWLSERGKLIEQSTLGEFIEIEVRRKDGAVVYLELSGMPVRGPSGEITGYRGTARDVTGRKRAEQALRESESKFRVLAETSPAGIFMYQGDRFVYVNPSLEREMGYSREEILTGLRLGDWFHPDDRKMIVARSEARMRGEPVPSGYEARVFTKSGELRWHLMTAGLTEYMGRPAGLVVILDITDRRRAEQALRESEERFRLCAAAAKFGTFDWDVVNDRHAWSPETYEIYGVAPGTPLTTGMIMDCIYPGDRQDETLAASLDPDGPGGYTMEYRIIRQSDRAVRWIYVKAMIVFSGEGTDRKAVRVLAAVQDITDRKAAEQRMLDSLREKDVLLKEIHHRVKNNMQIISSLLSLQSGSLSDEKTAQALRESQDRIRSMALIHEKLYQSGDISRIDFAEYVSSLITYLRDSYMTGHNVAVDVSVTGVSLAIDTAIPCGLIINELVTNSLKHAFREGRAGTIRVAMTGDGREYALTVSDDGPGLPPGMNLWNGPSLGLRLVAALVDQLGGHIETLPAPGATFVVRFREH